VSENLELLGSHVIMIQHAERMQGLESSLITQLIVRTHVWVIERV
jgi:hypothetical protein